MDNPWATTSNHPNHQEQKLAQTLSWSSTVDDQTHEQEQDIGFSSWSAGGTAQWPGPSRTNDPIWSSSTDHSSAWGSSSYAKINLSTQQTVDTAVQSEIQQEAAGPISTVIASEDSFLVPPAPVERSLALPTAKVVLPVTESLDLFGAFEAGMSTMEEHEDTEDGGEAWPDPISVSTENADEWGAAWAETLDSEQSISARDPPDEWESARQEKETLDRAVSPKFLAALIRKSEEVSGELWPETKSDSDSTQRNWRTGFDGLENLTILLNDLVPEGMTLPPPAQFSQTATAKSVNKALKLTRHIPLTRKSPMALLLASKGSLDWEKSLKARKDFPVDNAPMGWRILEKNERPAYTEAIRPKKSVGGLLSFWNRRTSPMLSTDAKVENARPTPSMSARSSMDSMKSPTPQRRGASSSSMPDVVMPVATSSAAPDIVIPAVTLAPSAVSRFLNRFSRTKGNESDRKSFALSTDDLEFLSDIVPSANDCDDDNDDTQLKALSNMINTNSTFSSPLPPKLPPPLAPPPKPPFGNTSRPSSIAGLNVLGITLDPVHSPQPTSARALFLPPPLSPATVMSSSRPHSLAVPPRQSPPTNTIFSAFTTPNIPTSIPCIPSSPPLSSRTHSPFELPPPLKAPSTVAIPPLLPPPPVSPPQTPRPIAPPMSVFTSSASSSKSGWSKSAWATVAYHDDDDIDDESFSVFSSLPRDPFPAPRESIDSSLGSPSSAQALTSAKSTSMSFDDFDDFVTSSRIRTPSPPPVPAKPAKVGGMQQMTSPKLGSSIHQRTQSLLDAAAQRRQWPSPVHAHPILPPPSSSLSPDIDLLGDDDAVLSAHSFGFPPQKVESAVVHQLSSPPLLSFSSLPPLSSQSRGPRQSVQTGGLTAQDLSFFEGL